MPERKYSVDEIDEMRLSLRIIMRTGVLSFSEPSPNHVEDRLRTYMLNGTAPEELSALARIEDMKWFEREEAARYSNIIEVPTGSGRRSHCPWGIIRRLCRRPI